MGKTLKMISAAQAADRTRLRIKELEKQLGIAERPYAEVDADQGNSILSWDPVAKSLMLAQTDGHGNKRGDTDTPLGVVEIDRQLRAILDLSLLREEFLRIEQEEIRASTFRKVALDALDKEVEWAKSCVTACIEMPEES